MTDASVAESSATREIELKRIETSSKYIGNMILIITAVSGAIALVVVVGVIVLAFRGVETPDVLSNWGGVILGFYFGQFVSLVKDYMGIVSKGVS